MSGYHRDGEAVARNTPVLVGGVDGSGNVQTLLLGTDGGMAVDLDATDLQIGAVEIKDGTSDNRAAVSSTGAVTIGGAVAHDAPDSGNPVKIGVVYRTSLPTLTSGDRSDAPATIVGHQTMAIMDQGQVAPASAARVTTMASDAIATTINGLFVVSVQHAFNGATFERIRVANIFKNLATAAVTAATPLIVWDPAAGKKPRLMCGELSMSVAGQLILKSGASSGAATEKLRSPQLAAGAVWSLPPIGNGILAAAADDNWYVDVTASGNVGGWVGGSEE